MYTVERLIELFVFNSVESWFPNLLKFSKESPVEGRQHKAVIVKSDAFTHDVYVKLIS